MGLSGPLFEKIGTIKNWLELSVVKSFGLNCHDLFCFCELYVMEKWVDLCENEKVRNQTSWRYFFWRNAFGKKAAWKQRRWFWGRSSNVSICVCCMSFKQSKTLCCSFLRLCFLVNLQRESMQEKHMRIPADTPAQFTMWTLTGLATHLLQKQNTSHPKILSHNPRESTTT